MQYLKRVHMILLSVLIWTGCESPASEGDDDDTPVDSDTGGDGTVLYNRCPQESRLGGFEATVLAEYSGVQGAVANGVLPASIAQKKFEQGGCILWKPPTLICDPPCSPDQACDFDGTCIPAPLNQDVGTVTITGLNKEIAMEPKEPGNNYFDADLPHPVFDQSNTEVQLTTTTGYVNAIALRGAGSNAITPQEDHWIITPGEDLAIHWDAPPPDPRTTVVLRLSVDQHGTSPASLVCELEDTGQGLVPAAAVDALIDAGVSGFPSGRLSRTTVDSVQVAQGCVEFAVESQISVEVSVSGFIPCTGPDTCPEGMICNLETFLCEEE